MKSFCLVIIFCCIFIACKSVKGSNQFDINAISQKELTPVELQTWYQKDYSQDGIPGISLDRWYKENKKQKKGKPIIVAIIDTQIDLKHEDLQGQLWTNSNEIPDNHIDDDHNGYVDDINGWSFTGTKSGGYVVWNKYEYVRIIKDWDSLFKGKTELEIEKKDIHRYSEYKRALKKFQEKDAYYKRWLKSLNYEIKLYPYIKDTLKYFFPKEDYTYKQLDSLYRKYKINDKKFGQRRDDNDKDLGALIDAMMACMEQNQKTLPALKDKQIQLDSIVNKNLNIQYNERLAIGDNPRILEKGYGNANVSNNKEGHRKIQDHCTKMAGVVGANRENGIGIKGMLQNVKIMPLNISPSGDEHDKDIAMAIRYAVDNGAKVINMSFSKEFSLHEEWVKEALKYADQHNVLLVNSAGNEAVDLDKITYYPSDIETSSDSEFCSNFIKVGSVTRHVDSTFVSSFSNYGKKNVDLFAPGDEIYSTASDNSYKFDSGTSMSVPMVSGTAALIWSYYPRLTALEVKQIIMNSGSSYTIDVIVPGTKDKIVPFSELSKSGKVLNVYNAMKFAEEISKKK
ncbi:S8 family peptidase [Flavobacterium sp. UW10123]|uniref:S8 family peptidase n=1 Tax=Flavobacterium sp. UW10123 TaxID=3230800 RepID=UPI003391EA06